MSKVRFEMAAWKAWIGNKPIGQTFKDGTYFCDELYDASGDYYPAAEVERLVEAAKEGLTSLEYVECNLPGKTGYVVRQQRIVKLKAALAALKGE